MSDQNLNELLDKLRDELAHTEVTDEASRERIRHLEADIRRLRERTDESSEADDTMLERFEDAINHFETSHPQLTLMISQMMTILSNAGI